MRCSFKTILRSWPPGLGRLVWSSASFLDRPLRDVPPVVIKQRAAHDTIWGLRLEIASYRLTTPWLSLASYCVGGDGLSLLLLLVRSNSTGWALMCHVWQCKAHLYEDSIIKGARIWFSTAAAALNLGCLWTIGTCFQLQYELNVLLMPFSLGRERMDFFLFLWREEGLQLPLFSVAISSVTAWTNSSFMAHLVSRFQRITCPSPTP